MKFDELDELHDNAARYEFLREQKVIELMERNALPVPMDDAYDWFDRMIDEQVRRLFPNGVMERRVK